jgi:YfiH family protein
MNGSLERACATLRWIPELVFGYETPRQALNNQKDKEFAQFRASTLLERAGFRNAFFLRGGGVSTGPYASLSFSVAAGDSQDNVDENLARAARALGVERNGVFFLSQVHGRVALEILGTEDRGEVVLREGDAIFGRNSNSALCVRMADCVPILVGDRESGAAVAIHAGWKGLVAGVIEAGIEAIRRSVGARGDLIAAIGPHIGVEAFEVSSDVAAILASASPDRHAVSTAFGPKPHVDLARIARAQLLALGLAEDAVERVPGCTHAEPDDFFSYRRDGPKSGRHLAGIVPRRAP